MLLLLRLPALLRAAGGAGLARLASTVVQVPKMGDSITEGTLIKLAVQPGERVKIDDVVCVIETDKVRLRARGDALQAGGRAGGRAGAGKALEEWGADKPGAALPTRAIH